MGFRQAMKILIMPAICAVIGCAMLFAVSCIPDILISENSSRSALHLKNMGSWTVLLNENDPSCTLDSYTDQQIIMESYTLSRANPYSVLLNPRHWTDDESQIGSFDALVNHSAPLNNNYFRYWMGFRIFVRPLLVFTDYFGILKFSGAVLTVLGFCAAAALGRCRRLGVAVCFGLSIALVNPAIIAQSLQFCCCFILSLLFILLVLHKRSKPEHIAPLFCLFGVATQFFDFYTTPLLCFGFPILLLLTFSPYRSKPWTTLIKTGISWFYGYVSMWIIKLSMVSLFTAEHGFYDGFNSLAGRLGVKVVEGLEEMYDIKGALEAVWWLSCPGDNEKGFFLFLAALVLLSAALILLKKGWRELLSKASFLAVAVLPVIWFCCAAQPTKIHSWFQYRTIAVLFAGVFLFSLQGLSLLPRKE